MKKVQWYSVERIEAVQVKDEKITMAQTVGICKECGHEIFIKELEDKNLKKLYAEYRRRKGLLQPEEIKRIRENLGLTQSQFAKLLDVTEKSIKHCECGSIQDPEIDKKIRQIQSYKNENTQNESCPD